MRSQRNFIAVSLFCLCFAFGQFLGAMPVLADSPPVLNEKTDPKILREYLKRVDLLIEKNGSKADYFYTKGQLYQWLKDFSKADLEFSKAISRQPSNCKALLAKGACLRKLKRWTAADRAYTKALSLHCDSCEAYTGRALARLAQGKYRQAVTDADSAISKNSKEGLAWFAKGSSQGFLGDYSSALANLDKAIELRPNQKEFVFRRRQVLRSLSQK